MPRWLVFSTRVLAARCSLYGILDPRRKLCYGSEHCLDCALDSGHLLAVSHHAAVPCPFCQAQAAARLDPSDEAPRSKRRRFEVPVPCVERPAQPPAHHLPPPELPAEAFTRSVSGAGLLAVVSVLAGARL